MNNTFYTYVYLNPLKPGNYNYGNYSFLYEPFYVGKGTRNRDIIHYRDFKSGSLDRLKNTQKYDTFCKIDKNGLAPIIIRLFNNLNNEFANIVEINMISTIGRRNLKQGPLSNLTKGGDGGDTFTNHPNKEEYRKKLSLATSGKNNPMYGRPLEKNLSHLSFLSGKHWNKGKARTLEQKENIKLSKKQKGFITSNAKICYMYDIDGNYLQEFGCVKYLLNFLKDIDKKDTGKLRTFLSKSDKLLYGSINNYRFSYNLLTKMEIDNRYELIKNEQIEKDNISNLNKLLKLFNENSKRTSIEKRFEKKILKEKKILERKELLKSLGRKNLPYKKKKKINPNSILKGASNGMSKKVYMYDINLKILKIFDTIVDAKKFTGISRSLNYRCFNEDLRPLKGYVFSFKELNKK